MFEAVRQILLQRGLGSLFARGMFTDCILTGSGRKKNCICYLTFNVRYLTAKSVRAASFIIRHKLLKSDIYDRICLPASAAITQPPFWRLKGFGRRQTHLVSSHSSSYMLLYADQGSCTFPYQSTVLDIRDVEPGCICFRGWTPSNRVIPL